MAVAVVSGQVYVGTGYRDMAKATKSTAISVTCIPEYVISSNNKTGEFE